MSRSLTDRAGSGLGLAYAVVCYVAAVASLGYAVLFLLGAWVPTRVDDPATRSWAVALGIDLLLVVGWGLQHSVMARGRFKRWWTRVIPAHTERATYCLASAVALAAVCLLWEPIPGVLWTVDAVGPRLALQVLGVGGWLLMLAATFEIDHAELFGLEQPYRALVGAPEPAHGFQQRLLYRVVRHPIQLGVLLGMWVTPDMTASRVLFAGCMTAYILLGLHFEERALVREFGGRYREYQARVPMLVPGLRSLLPYGAPQLQTTGTPTNGTPCGS